jgi:hypothetical protein
MACGGCIDLVIGLGAGIIAYALKNILAFSNLDIF